MPLTLQCNSHSHSVFSQDCLRGLEKAVRAGFLDAADGKWRFDIGEYEHYEQVSLHSTSLITDLSACFNVAV